MRNPKIVVFSGSIRGQSSNTRLAGVAVKALSLLDCEVTHISLADYEMPIYDGDLEAQSGAPDAAIRLARLFDNHHGMVIASPEYNGSITPLLKNTLDWVSRVSSDEKGSLSPYKNKIAAMISCSPGKFSGVNSLAQLRPILCTLGMLVINEKVMVGNSGSAFDDLDNLADERTRASMENACASLVEKAALFNLGKIT